MNDPRLSKLAQVLVHYSTKVKKGDFVLVSGDEVTIPLLCEVTREAIAAGGHVETLISSQEIGEVRLKHSTEEQLIESSLIMETVLAKADAWISAWGSLNTRMSSNVPADRIKLAAQGATPWRRIYSDRTASGALRWCGTQFPTHADAQEASMSLADYEDFVFGAGLLDAEDPIGQWQSVHAEQEQWIQFLNRVKELHIKADGTDLRVSVGGRRWINCDGSMNFPDGEVFTSPVDDAIDGHITFSFPGIYAGKEIEGIRLRVAAGRVVEATATKGEDLLQALLATDDGASRFGEVAIGTNYQITKFTRNMLFDEKIGGTVHLAIGDSMGEAGGINKSAIHWDMLCDMRNGGTVSADGRVFYRDGRFLPEVLS
ncbi:aminopeptidase [Candidatus Fermentibacteria bacterium]|nr:aminopeptidase [Candidatus Fermentibacteria bacterium]